MKTINITRLKKVTPTAKEYENITAFQLVIFNIDFFGNKENFTLDTKFTKDGKQLVIGGNGWIEDGYDITSM